MSDIPSRLNVALEGRYSVEREIGQGGMATVYLADDLKHERKVALKVLKPELAAVVGAERFLAEIKTTANLQHPHILPLFDSGEADGFLFYVMPYLEGETLRERINREKQLPVDEAVRIGTAVANALQHAHDRGVIHRDIKPANILLQDGEPVVADFGIALAVGAAGGSRLTETGLSVGTPYYMSPEQATGDQQVGPPSDTYALAAVIYEMLTGEPPYTGTTAQAVLGRILQGAPVSATEIRASVPANVDAAVRKALEKLPADRFTGAHSLAVALADPGFRHGAEGELAGAGRRAGGLWNPLSIGLAVVSAALFGWTVFGSVGPSADSGVSRHRVKLWSGTIQGPGLDGTLPVSMMAAISPDGSTVVFSDTVDGTSQLFRKQRHEAVAAPLAGTENGIAPAFSPDGEWIAFSTPAGELRKVPSIGGGSITLADDLTVFSAPFWGDDGFIYYTETTFGIGRVGENGEGREVVVETADRFGLFTASIWTLPGGRGLVFSGCAGNCNASDIYVYDFEADTVVQIVSDAYGAWYLPTGHLVYTDLAGGAFAAPFDPSELTLTGGAVPVLPEVVPEGLVVSPSGVALYGVGGSSASNELTWVSREGAATLVDPNWLGYFQYPAISPDGGRLAISLADGADEQIWVKQLDRGPEEKLTLEGSVSFRPAWTPDGRSISYITGGEDLSRDLYLRRADGSSDPEVQIDLEGDGIWEAQYSADGKWLLYRTDRGATGDILALALDGDGEPIPMIDSAFDERMLALSPDARWLAYISNRSGRYEVYVRPFPNTGDSRSVVTSDGGSAPAWSPDGSELFFKEAGMFRSVEVLPGESFRFGEATDLFPVAEYLTAGNRRQYDVGPDGDRFLMIRNLAASELNLIYVENWFEELLERVGR